MRLVWVSALALGSVVIGGGAVQAAGPPQVQDAERATAAQAPANGKRVADQRVTLLTGDRVILPGGDLRRATVEPGPGRKHVGFSVQRAGGELLVIPLDVRRAVADGVLDRRLFSVTTLLANRYDDAHSKSIPLLVSYRGARSSLPAATVTRVLPVIGGAALRVEKTTAGTFLRSLAPAGNAARGAEKGVPEGVSKVWLDSRRKPLLDKSVPQIGAPAAWQAGLTGRGVTVAVLDTGVDRTHPDLADRIAGQKNFTSEQGSDLVGHGTHVASIVAGTGAASTGRYRGVAPEAKILDAKVCQLEGCPDSAILAGMEWAAKEQRAQVINLSVGGPDTPELDPIEQAVNRLSAETGALFVIAAGNDGPGSRTVNSPGTAAAALTVGAVDAQDQVAGFSSRGSADTVFKPDLSAPGVDIVAARSKEAVIGEPVDDHYLRMSGTSMATPHVAGAAALLAQQVPVRRAGDLKSLLMASAKQAGAVYEQGAGRVDLKRAIGQQVISQPTAVDFGQARWPHDDDAPITKTVTYRNTGAQPITLAVDAKLTGPDGTTADLKLSASSVTVPANGTASVVLTAVTTDGPDGEYTGRITATAGNQVVTTPAVLAKEPESYDLTYSQLGPDGKPANAVLGVYEFGERRLRYLRDSGKIRLPKASYALDTTIQTRAGEIFYLGQPRVDLDRDMTVVLDARKAKPVRISVPRPAAKVHLLDIGYLRKAPGVDESYVSHVLLDGQDGVYVGRQGPALPADQLTSFAMAELAAPGADGHFRNTPYTYHLVAIQHGQFYDGYTRDVREAELGRIVSQHNRQSGRQVQEFVSGGTAELGFSRTGLQYDQPSTVTHWVEAGPFWSVQYDEFVRDQEGWIQEVTGLETAERTYRAGETVQLRLGAAVVGPRAFDVARDGDSLRVGIGNFSDADGHVGYSVADTASGRLFRDGKVVGAENDEGYVVATGLPAERSEYELVIERTRPSISKLSTATTLRWKFSSAATAKDEQLPLPTIRFQPAVDKLNQLARRPVTALPLRIESQLGAAGKVSAVKVEYSGDGGKTWRRASVVPKRNGSYLALFATPAGASVSLRAAVTADGSSVEQTVVDAYHQPPA